MLLLFSSSISMSAQPIYIGLDADLSAVAKDGGIAIKRGALIAIEEINNNGGVLGRPFSLIEKDHRGNPARGIANIKAFAQQESLVAVLGGVHTPVAMKELPIIHQHQIIYLDPWAAGTPIIDNGFDPNFAFRVSVRDAEAGKVLIGYAKKRGLKRIGLLLERTGWGRSNESSMTAAANANGVEVAGVEWFNWGQKDVSKQIAALVDLDIDGFALVANSPEGAVIGKQILLNPAAAKLPIISHWGVAGGAFVEMLGLENLNKLDISVLQTYSFVKPYNVAINKKVISAYRRMFDPNATENSVTAAVGVAHAYDLVHLLAMAIKKAKSIDRSVVRASLETLGEYEGLVKRYTAPFGDGLHDALLAKDYIIARFDALGRIVPVEE
jgi:branched-chain amino acid transport system substrate-binding protein